MPTCRVLPRGSKCFLLERALVKTDAPAYRFLAPESSGRICFLSYVAQTPDRGYMGSL